LFISIVLVGCNTSPQEFAVSGVPVYTAENPDQLFMGEESVVMKFYDSNHTFVVGRIEGGKLTLSIPGDVPDELFDNPNYLAVDSATPGLHIATGTFFPDIYVYDILNKQEYLLLYASKSGSFVLENIEYNLTYGWNLIVQKEKSLGAPEIQHSLQYKWVRRAGISAKD
jgi:hypothetical protein